MRLLMLLGLLGLLGSVGCTTLPSTQSPVVEVVEVKVPIPTACIKAMPSRPEVTTLADILKLGNADAALVLMTQHNVLLAYVGELEAVVSACVAK